MPWSFGRSVRKADLPSGALFMTLIMNTPDGQCRCSWTHTQKPNFYKPTWACGGRPPGPKQHTPTSVDWAFDGRPLQHCESRFWASNPKFPFVHEYIRKDLYSVIKAIYKAHIRRYIPFISYIAIVRVGKKYCPYHIRWHGTFVTLYNQFIGICFDSAERAHKMIFETLIPQGRYEEAANMRIYLGII